jgi:hypothetical protein
MFARMKSSRSGNLLLELLLIVVGINIALWFEGLAEDYREARSEQRYLQGLRDDLLSDTTSLDQIIGLNEARLESVESMIPQLQGMRDASPELQATIVFGPATYHFFNPSDFTYRAMQESGDFRLLSDAQLKQELLRLVREYRFIDELQRNFLQALDDGYIPLMMNGFDFATLQVTDPSLPENQLFRNFFFFTLQDTSQRLDALRAARDRVAALMLTIEGQLD